MKGLMLPIILFCFGNSFILKCSSHLFFPNTITFATWAYYVYVGHGLHCVVMPDCIGTRVV